MTLLGYLDRLSVNAGQVICAKISAAAPVTAQVGQFVGGAFVGLEHPANGRHEAHPQPLLPGSFGRTDVLPIDLTQPFAFEAWIYSTGCSIEHDGPIVSFGDGVQLVVRTDGALVLEVDGFEVVGPSIPRRRWTGVSLSWTSNQLWRLSVRGPYGDDDVEANGPAPTEGSKIIWIGSRANGGGLGTTFDGKIDLLQLRCMSTDGGSIAVHWTADATRSATHLIASEAGWDVQLTNHPTLAVTGKHWDGTETDPRRAPAHWSAAHFHCDDLTDAQWSTTFELRTNDSWNAGVYAIHLASGEDDFWLPFVVRNPSASRRVCFLLPTMTYAAYANWRHAFESESFVNGDYSRIMAHPPNVHPADAWLDAHPEVGLSLYERHTDGSGVTYSSLRRPIMTWRPDHHDWKTGAQRHFAADLDLLAWLQSTGHEFDVLTDHDLHQEGRGAIDQYTVLVTGSHPEYVSHEILAAIDGHLADGRHLMYLGGNGFEKVSSLVPGSPSIVEIRRGFGPGPWTSSPGETHLSSTGEPGGLWEHRGRPPHALLGVGFTSEGWEGAAGYVRTEASREARFVPLFEGIGPNEVIGDFGASLGGAAGDEMDRLDYERGSPRETVLLATSSGRHSRYYILEPADWSAELWGLEGPDNPRIRADMTWYRSPTGGIVFSVGSMNWAPSIRHADGDNNVALISTNVLRHLLEGD